MASDLIASEVLVGTANGAGIYIAPLGTAMPKDTTTALDPAWKALGYTTDDGVEQSMDLETEDIMSWQSMSPVRNVMKSKVFTFKFSLLQWNADTLALFMGVQAPTPSADGSFTLDLKMGDVPTQHALLIDLDDYGKKVRMGMYRTTLSSSDTLTLQRGAAAPLPVELKALDVNGQTGIVIVGPNANKGPVSTSHKAA